MKISSLFSLEAWFFKAHSLYCKGHQRLANLMAMHYNSAHACDIHPGTKIGKGTTFAHRGLGVVINKNAVIGSNCRIFHGVTIGGQGGSHDNSQPIIGDNVFIGCNSVILGGVKIGDNAIIGAGSVVIKDVPSNATVVGVPAKNTKEK